MTTRILHVSQPTEAGVAEVVLALTAAQVELGWDVSLACPVPSELASRAASVGVRVRPWLASRQPGPSVAREARDLARVVADLDPEVVHLHSAKAGLAGRLAIRGRVPTIFQPHAWSFHAVSGHMRQACLRWERWAVRWTDLLVGVSQDELDEGTRAKIAPRRAVVVHNGVDVSRFTTWTKDEARRAVALLDAPTVVCVGRLTRQKGQDVLLDAWQHVVEQLPEARLVLVGDGPEREELEGRDLPRVRFAGNQRDVAPWLAAADVVAVPSRWEGMALAPLEAMASGRSVVSSTVAGAQESSGDCGASVPVEDAEALARALLARLADPTLAAEEGRCGAARVRTLFSVETMCSSAAEQTLGLLGRGGFPVPTQRSGLERPSVALTAVAASPSPAIPAQWVPDDTRAVAAPVDR